MSNDKFKRRLEGLIKHEAESRGTVGNAIQHIAEQCDASTKWVLKMRSEGISRCSGYHLTTKLLALIDSYESGPDKADND